MSTRDELSAIDASDATARHGDGRAPGAAGFSPALLDFLRELAAHNDRDWFAAEKRRFEERVRAPVLGFIAGFAPRLAELSPSFVADARPAGGSMLRMYRDTRFSRASGPYHTSVIVNFRHERGRAGVTPMFRLRIQPGESSLSAGIWQPERGALRNLRRAIVANPGSWSRITQDRRFRARCVLVGRSLEHAPPGFDGAHPLAGDLRRKDFACELRLDDRTIVSDRFGDEVFAALELMVPFLAFVTRAVGLSF